MASLAKAAYLKAYAQNPANQERIRAAKRRWYLRVKGTESHRADHIVPLKHPLVSGLHVEFNLQVITKSENSKKKNRFVVGGG